MSEVIGLMAVGDSEHEVFLGRELGQRRQVSEHTAQQVDQEVKRILDVSHDRARVVLEEHQDLLERIALALLERETLDADEIALLDRGESLPPLEVPGEALQAPPPGGGAWGRLRTAPEAEPVARPGGLGDDPNPAAPAEG